MKSPPPHSLISSFPSRWCQRDRCAFNWDRTCSCTRTNISRRLLGNPSLSLTTAGMRALISPSIRAVRWLSMSSTFARLMRWRARWAISKRSHCRSRSNSSGHFGAAELAVERRHYRQRTVAHAKANLPECCLPIVPYVMVQIGAALDKEHASAAGMCQDLAFDGPRSIFLGRSNV